MSCMRKLAFILAVLLGCALPLRAQQVSTPPAQNERWTSVRSKNFLLVGNSNDGEMRQLARRLEQFRTAFPRLNPEFSFNSFVPTTIMVFKSDAAYEPFKPHDIGAEIAGYFQPGTDINYITISTESRAQNPERTILHEYVHLLVNSHLGETSPWFNEGLSEYYSTFELWDEKKIILGHAVPNHVRLLRRLPLIPLRTLLAVDYTTLYRSDHDARGFFYAESWALMHYLLSDATRRSQLMEFIAQLQTGATLEKALSESFKTDLETLEKEFKAYVAESTFPWRLVKFEQRLLIEENLLGSELAEADADAYLGDLLMRINRPSEAEARLQQALSKDSRHALAHAALGRLRAAQKRYADARLHLQRAVEADPQNYFMHYAYAYGLSREGIEDGQYVSSFTTEATEIMRAELRRAIALNPDFPESYHLLAFINLVRGEALDETVSLLERALVLTPGREAFTFLLAQVHLQRNDFKRARQLLEPLTRSRPNRRLSTQAQSMLNAVTSMEENVTRLRARDQAASSDNGSSNGLMVNRRRYVGERVRGILTRVECTVDEGVVLHVTAGERLLKFYAPALERIRFVSYVANMGREMTCGALKSPSYAFIIFRPLAEAQSAGRNTGGVRVRHSSLVKLNGEVIAVEFVPEDFEDVNQ